MKPNNSTTKATKLVDPPPDVPERRATYAGLRSLSLAELLEACEEPPYSGAYEDALVEGLHAESCRLAFSGEDPADAPRGLPAFDERANAAVFGEPPVWLFEHGNSCRLFVLETPRGFARRHVARYNLSAPEYAARIHAGGAGTTIPIQAWLSETPVRPTHPPPRSLPAPLRAPAVLRDAARAVRLARRTAADPRDPAREAARAWLAAFPGLFGDYERRVLGRWTLDRLSHYGVTMRFYEDLGIMDFCSGGLLALYPMERTYEPYRTADIHTGEVTLPTFDEAASFMREVFPVMEGRGVRCNPRVVLRDTAGRPYEPVDPVAEASHRLRLLFPEPAGDEGRQNPFPDDLDGHLPLSGLSAAVPGREQASYLLRRKDSFMVAHARAAELRRRIKDPGVPGPRRRDLAGDLREVEAWRDGEAARLLADPSALIGLLASVEHERSVLHDSHRFIYDSNPDDEGTRTCIRLAADRLSSLREPSDPDG